MTSGKGKQEPGEGAEVETLIARALASADSTMKGLHQSHVDAKRDEAREVLAALKSSGLAVVPMSVLEFYADPRKFREKANGWDQFQIPDFYDELNFGDRAQEAIAMLRAYP